MYISPQNLLTIVIVGKVNLPRVSSSGREGALPNFVETLQKHLN